MRKGTRVLLPATLPPRLVACACAAENWSNLRPTHAFLQEWNRWRTCLDAPHTCWLQQQCVVPMHGVSATLHQQAFMADGKSFVSASTATSGHGKPMPLGFCRPCISPIISDIWKEKMTHHTPISSCQHRYSQDLCCCWHSLTSTLRSQRPHSNLYPPNLFDAATAQQALAGRWACNARAALPGTCGLGQCRS